MKKLALLGVVVLSGCTNLDKSIEALGKDGAIVTGRIGTVYGTLDFRRVGATTNSVEVTPEGKITVNPVK